MKSVGEVMAIGRTFQESLQKALRGLETGVDGLDEKTDNLEIISTELANPGPERLWYIADAFRCKLSIEEVHQLTHIDVWFLAQIEDLVKQEQALTHKRLEAIDKQTLRKLKRSGFSTAPAKLLNTEQTAVRIYRHNKFDYWPVYKRVDPAPLNCHQYRIYVLHLRRGMRIPPHG